MNSSFRLNVRTLGSTKPDAPTAFVIHGILGSGRNLLSFTNRLQKSAPEFRFHIIDLRNHGESQSAPPGDDLVTVAADLIQLEEQLGEPQVVIAHSYGGKVAIRYVEAKTSPVKLWILDTCPSAAHIDFSDPKGNVVLTVLEALESVTPPPQTRQATIDRLLEKGLSQMVAMWLATNLKKKEHGLDWVFERQRIAAMIADYYAFDAWPFLEGEGALHEIHFVLGGESNRFNDDEIDRLELLHQTGAIELHVLEGAGHWVHIDKPDELLEEIVSCL